jgi:signal transduction histidine kinase
MSAWRWNPGPELRLVFWISCLGIGSAVFASLLQQQRVEWTVVLGLALVLIGYQLYRFLRKAQEEVKDFAESVRYRDFSRNFNLKDAPADIRPLREGFNTINNTFRSIRREKETQYQYLQQILELVDIGILSYEVETGNQNWMNQAFRNMLEIPYLKNIHTLKLRDEALYEEIMAIRPGETRIVTVHTQQRNLKILIAGTLFQTDGISNKLLAFQNINTALDETEARAWQRLLSVMTHEIMNSVAPISSLAATLKRMATEPDLEENRADLELGLETIQRRSEGLLKFAETYRSLNKIVKPNLSEIYIRDLFESLLTLMEPSLDQKNISLEVILKEPRLTAWLDVNLVEQVLINLLVNASEAVRETEAPRIVLSGTLRNQLLVIRIADNGSGIEPEILDKIFIPFFSTKKSGSGIGLSLCKQIMLLHKGNIQVFSKVGEGTAFELEFPVNGA